MIDFLQDAKIIRNTVNKVYWESKFARLRTLIEEDDLLQMTYLKLLHRDNYKKYSPKYSKVTFIYNVSKRVAISYSSKKYNLKEYTILNKPITEDKKNTPMMFLKTLTTELKTDKLDFYPRLLRISANMPERESHYMAIRYKNKLTPFSISRMFDLFIHLKCQKYELMKYIINTKSNSPVSSTAFRYLWDEMYSCAVQELKK